MYDVVVILPSFTLRTLRHSVQLPCERGRNQYRKTTSCKSTAEQGENFIKKIWINNRNVQAKKWRWIICWGRKIRSKTAMSWWLLWHLGGTRSLNGRQPIWFSLTSARSFSIQLFAESAVLLAIFIRAVGFFFAIEQLNSNTIVASNQSFYALSGPRRRRYKAANIKSKQTVKKRQATQRVYNVVHFIVSD